MPIATTWRPIAASLLAGVAVLAMRAVADPSGVTASGVTASRATTSPVPARDAFRRSSMTLVEADVAERDATWHLGRKLFFDPSLSRSGRISCATCHPAGHGWSGTLKRAVGDGGTTLAFRAPTLLDVGQLERLGWIGRFADTAAVTTFAMTSPTNMDMTLPEVASRARGDAGTVAAFHAAFPNEAIDGDRIVQALTVFVNSLSTEAAPFDRWIAGDERAVGSDAKRGFALFTGKARCVECHRGSALTDGSFHDIGTGSGPDIGRGTLFKSSVKLRYAFKTPTLRNVAERAPYMHDGSIASLAAVVDHYDKGGIDRPSRDTAIRPLKLSQREKDDLIAFLATLTSETRYVMSPPGE